MFWNQEYTSTIEVMEPRTLDYWTQERCNAFYELRQRLSHRICNWKWASPTRPAICYQNPSVVRYFDSLGADWSESDSGEYTVHSEPLNAPDVEVLFVHRQASHQDIVQSRDKSHRKLLDMFDWDAMKMPVQSSDHASERKPDGDSDEETDSSDEREPPQPTAAVELPHPNDTRIPGQSVACHAQYVVFKSDIQNGMMSGTNLSSNEDEVLFNWRY